MGKILIIEDTNDINDMIKDALLSKGHSCTQAYSGTEGLLLIKLEDFDLVILDLMLPGKSGEEVLREIKALKKIPVIVSSAKGDIDSKLNCLEDGADDYITKPFEIRELVARVSVQLRKNSTHNQTDNPSENTLEYKELKLNTEAMELSVNGTIVDLTKHEYKILELFLSYPDKVFTKQAIYDYAWDEYFIGEDKTINVHISNLRKKLKNYTETEYIETVWATGFKLKK